MRTAARDFAHGKYHLIPAWLRIRFDLISDTQTPRAETRTRGFNLLARGHSRRPRVSNSMRCFAYTRPVTNADRSRRI